MIDSPVTTRAEISDVANPIMDLTDTVIVHTISDSNNSHNMFHSVNLFYRNYHLKFLYYWKYLIDCIFFTTMNRYKSQGRFQCKLFYALLSK